MGILSNENAISTSGYSISNSLRFQSSNSQYLSRTYGTPTGTNICTFSFWVKRGSLSSSATFPIYGLQAGGDANNTSFIGFNNDAFTVSTVFGGTQTLNLTTAQVFRDCSSWYHFVVSLNRAAGFATVYVNGQNITQYSTAIIWNSSSNGYFNTSGNGYGIGTRNVGGTYFDGYLSEVNFIDGQSLTPSSFGSTDPTSGQWVAKKYTGTYGTNGFYLPFSNGTSTTTLGADSSGNSNNWTLTNFTRSAGVSDCWMTDVPSGNGSAGTQPNSNYCVLNPIGVSSAPVGTITQGNLNYAASASANYSRALGTIGVSSGKWYWEIVINSANRIQVGIIGINDYSLYYPGYSSVGYCYDQQTGNKVNNNTFTAYGATLTTNDIVGVAFDADAGTLTFYKNNTSQGTAFTGLSGTFVPAVGNGSSSALCSGLFNFGQRSFAYTPPTGFKALCTANLPVATIKQGNKYMDATLYTGNGSTQTITNASGFKPDLVWIKGRSFASTNWLTDSVRGATKILTSNATDAEQTNANTLTSFNAGGFSVGSNGDFNTNAASLVGWQWQAGQGSTSSNTNGSITSTVSVNATAGFSVVTYTGTGANATVGHGLGVAPKMVIVKSRSGAGASYQWFVWHTSIPNTNILVLNATNGLIAATDAWNSTSPTSTTISVGTNAAVNGSTSTFVAYCFAEISGYSKAFSYTGNGSTDGSFIYCGFLPRFVMLKRTDTTGDWYMWDTARNTYDVITNTLLANSSAAETSATSIDALSNGFKMRNTTAGFNASGGTYIGFAWATNPFAQSNAF